MSAIDAVMVVLAYPMQIIFFAWAIYLALKSEYAQATFCMSFSIMMLLLVRLNP